MTSVITNKELNNKALSSNISPLARKFVYIDNSDYYQKIETDTFKKNVKYGEIPSNVVNKDKIKSTISTAKTVLNLTSNIVTITGQKEDFEPFLKTSTGTLLATEGVIKLTDVNKENNKVKNIMSSMSTVANGVATVLSVVNIPEAEFIGFAGKALGVGVEQQNLTENINKKNSRGIVGSAVGIVKGAWGLTLSGAKVTTLSATIGNKLGKVSTSTLEKVSTKASKITKFADKVAVPFAITGSALSYWDWQISRDKYKSKEAEKIEEIENNPNNIDKIRKLEKEAKSFKTDSIVKGISFGLSVISSTALTVSIVFPLSAPVSKPIALLGSIASSLTSSFDTQEKRDSVEKLYKKSLSYHDKLVNFFDRIIFAPKYIN
jgi:hypothetical protein